MKMIVRNSGEYMTNEYIKTLHNKSTRINENIMNEFPIHLKLSNFSNNNKLARYSGEGYHINLFLKSPYNNKYAMNNASGFFNYFETIRRLM